MPTNMDPNLPIFDVYDDYTLTRMIEIRKPEARQYDIGFAPMVAHPDRRVKLHIRRWNGSGNAPFRAVNANTPIMPEQGTIAEQYIDLVNIAEMAIIDEEDLLTLNSPDEVVRMKAITNIVEKTEHLRIRNTNRSRWMVWQAVQDSLSITYPDGGAITVDWDLNKSDWNSWFYASHLPTASTDWNATVSGDYTTDIITDVQTWTDILARDGGVVEETVRMYVNTATWRIIQQNEQIKAALSSTQPRDIRPKRPEAAEVLGISSIEIVDSYYWDESDGTRYKHLDDGRALFLGPQTAPDGLSIVELKDGPVVYIGGNGRATVAANTGLRAEIYTQFDPPAEFVRVQSARIPVINHPEMLLFATLW